PTHNSRGVASCDPSTRPMFAVAVSGMHGLRGQERGQTTLNQARNTELMPEVLLERTNGYQVLRGAGIPCSRGDEAWQTSGERVGEGHCARHADTFGNLQSHDAGEIRLHAHRLSKPHEPGIASKPSCP